MSQNSELFCHYNIEIRQETQDATELISQVDGIFIEINQGMEGVSSAVDQLQ